MACRPRWSLSARRAWIEICYAHIAFDTLPVALRKESVDRNCIILAFPRGVAVALRKESVDRNYLTMWPGIAAW